MRPLYRQRDFMLLWGGQVISAVGSQVSGIALPLLVLGLTGSPAQAGVVGALEGLPYLLLSLPAGVLVDRWNRRTLMVGCDLGRALNLGTIPLALATGHLSLLQLYLNGLVEGSLFVPFNLAEASALPRVVAAEQLGAATAQNGAIWPLSALSGPPLGGALYALGRALPFLGDAISYLLSALSLSLIRVPLQGQVAAGQQLWQEIGSGIRWLRAEPGVRFVALFSAAGDFLFSGVDLILIVAARQAGAPPAAIGLIFTLAALGGLAGTPLASAVERRLGLAPILIGTSWLIAALYILFALSFAPPVLGLIWAGISLLVTVSNTARFTYQVRRIPDAMRGRVNSLINLAAYGSLPLGQAATGATLQLIGPRVTILLVAAALAALALWASLSRAHVLLAA